MEPSSRDLSIYLHVPFCESKCPYCDFYSAPAAELGIEPETYFDWVMRELDLVLGSVEELRGRRVVTVYVGGGTPSLFEPEEYGRFYERLRGEFAIDPQREWTLEVNPGTASPGRLDEYALVGVNRFSVGVQSFNDEKLRRLGRRHSSAESRALLGHLKAGAGAGAGWAMDLIFGAPGETLAEWRADLEVTLEWRPEHCSVYGLTMHEGTLYARLYGEGRLDLPGEELEREMFLLTRNMLQHNGYIHYEISNYALAGAESRHNTRYWTGEDYLGLGSAAHSFISGVRWSNPPDLRYYLNCLSDGRLPRVIESPPESRSRLGELVMLGLRQLKGIDLEAFERTHGVNLLRKYHREIGELASPGLLEIVKGQLRLTEEGLLVADAVMAKFF